MGTRNLSIVIQKNKTKVAQYCQWDGYPTGSGSAILKFLNREDFNLENFKSKISCISEYSKEEIDKIDKDDNWEKNYPHLSRNVGPDILNIIYDGSTEKVSLDVDFIYDSLFCEWAYVIDLDNDKFEVYKGFNKDKLNPSDRFYTEDPNDGGYYACKLYGVFSLDNIPRYFLEDGEYQSKDGSIGKIENTLKSFNREVQITKITS